MDTVNVGIRDVKINKANPRTIRDAKFNKLVDSLLLFPEMLNVRPVVVSKDMTCLGGNMRTRALIYIAGLEESDVIKRLKSSKGYGKKSEKEQAELVEYWGKWYDNPTIPVVIADSFTGGQAKEFVIKDNSDFGEWDWEMLANEWDEEDLDDWGIDIPKKTLSATERLSGRSYAGLYYEPEKTPGIKLKDCVNTEKYEAKVKAIEGLNLSEKQKDALKIFAYRFIKIDFEAVANYYAFNASDEEKKAIERLRLVLVDDGVDGYIEDDMLRIMNEDIEDMI